MRTPVFIVSAAVAAVVLAGCSSDGEKSSDEPSAAVSEHSKGSDGKGSKTTNADKYDGTYRATSPDIIDENREVFERLAREENDEEVQAMLDGNDSGALEYDIVLDIDGEKCSLVFSENGEPMGDSSQSCVIDYDKGVLKLNGTGDDSESPIEFKDKDRFDLIISDGGEKFVYPFKKVKD